MELIFYFLLSQIAMYERKQLPIYGGSIDAGGNLVATLRDSTMEDVDEI